MGVTQNMSWSHSRSKMFRGCRREGFLYYYAHNEPESYDAWNLRELTNLMFLSGNVVDQVIADALNRFKQSGEIVQDLADEGRTRFREHEAESRHIVAQMRVKARTAEERRANRYQPLHHHYHDLELGQEYSQQRENRVAECLDIFEHSEIWNKLREIGPTKWGPITTLLDETPKFRFEEIPVYAKFDIWFKDERDVVILDWKSGNKNPSSESNAERQLAVYALYGNVTSKIERRFFTQVVWLSEAGDYAPKLVSDESIEEVKSNIRSEVASELALIQIREYKSGRREYVADRKDFPPNPSARRCCNCNFHTICAEGTAMTSHLRN